MGEDFKKRFGNLTVGEAIELNEAARRTCEFEATSQCEGGSDE